MLSPERKRLLRAELILAGVSIAVFLAMVSPGWSHPVTTVDGKQLDIVYPGSCCSSAATNPYGDCAPIDDRYVTEGADGYQVDIPIGGHPKLKSKGYSGLVPYSQAKKQPLSNDYHICLSTDGAARFCFFPKPGNV